VGCGWTGAILLSSALFASLHIAQGWLGIVQIFPVGLALAVFFVLTRSLTAVILAHFLFDLVQTQLARLLWPALEKYFQNA
jgi:membrane protease YdiL (CAAX protease family)